MRAFITFLLLAALLPILTSCAPNPDVRTIWSGVSPDGKYDATLTRTTTNVVLNQDTEAFTLRVEKRGAWFYTTDMEYNSLVEDDGCPEPAASWTGPSTLKVHIVTRHTSGKLERRDDDLTVVREYLLQPRASVSGKTP